MTYRINRGWGVPPKNPTVNTGTKFWREYITRANSNLSSLGVFNSSERLQKDMDLERMDSSSDDQVSFLFSHTFFSNSIVVNITVRFCRTWNSNSSHPSYVFTSVCTGHRSLYCSVDARWRISLSCVFSFRVTGIIYPQKSRNVS